MDETVQTTVPGSLNLVKPSMGHNDIQDTEPLENDSLHQTTGEETPNS